jgi:hypothetical protein
MIKKLRSNKFYNKPFNSKKRKLKRLLFLYIDCKINDSILCFEDRDLAFDVRFATKDSTPDKLRSFTVGKVYKIIDKKNNKIKIKGDRDAMVWTTPNRFLGTIALRIIKLKELNKIHTKTKYHVE